MLSRDEQFLNAPGLIFNTVFGILTFLREVQFSKDSMPIDWMPSAKVTAWREEQFLNASLPIFIIEDGM